MRKLIVCDKNKKLITEVKKFLKDYGNGVFNEVEVICGDVIKVHEKTPNSRIVTASNPEFSPDGGLDAVLAKKYTWNPKEFYWDNDLFYAISVDKNRQSSKEILLRLAVGVLGYSTTFIPILTGVGTGVGGIAVEVFIEILRTIISNLVSADLRSVDLRFADLVSADLRYANLRYADLRSVDLRFADLRSADLVSADLRSADLRSVDLRYANLRYANLRSADLVSADLRSADLLSADLRFADLRSADLVSAKNFPELYVDNLAILKCQKNKLIAYKFVKKDFTSPINGNLLYKVGTTVIEKDCETDETISCGKGLNVATKEWCLREMDEDKHILLEIEFSPKDIVAIPYNTDGKFRVSKLKVLKVVKVK